MARPSRWQRLGSTSRSTLAGFSTPEPTREPEAAVAVMALRGDLRQIACHAWYLPGDFARVVGRGWTRGDDDLAAAVAELRIRQVPDDWHEGGTRVEALTLKDARRGTPILCAIPNRGTDDWTYHQETLSQFVALATAVPAPQGCVRERPLLAVPVIGTGLSTWNPSFDAHITGLLAAATTHEDVDLVIVAGDDVTWAALQAVRRRSPIHAAIAHLETKIDALAAKVRTGELVLFTGAGTGVPAGLPSWRDLLEELRASTDLPDAAFKELGVLDQAALLEDRVHEPSLVERVAERLDAPHYAITHGFLASLPVRENVTLNYDTLLERAAAAAGRPLAVLPYEPAAGSWLLKLHGCIAPARRHDIVLTRDHYLRLGEHRAHLSGIVQALLVTRHMLFIGFGLSDDHLHQVLHDVRRAVGDARRDDLLGTAIVLEHDPMQELLWQRDLHYVPMTEHGPPLQAARLLELFLDALLLRSTSSEQYLFDDRFAGLLTSDERELRDLLRDAFEGSTPGDSTAWTRSTALLHDLGWILPSTTPQGDPR
jgi:hypothetical protein